MAILSLRDVHAFYGKAHVLQGINLSIDEGKIVGIFGRNGAGKTTLLRSIMNLVPRVTGEVTFEGRNLAGVSTDTRARSGIVYMTQDMRVFPDLTVRENCLAAQKAAVVPPKVTFDAVIDMIPELKEHVDRPAGKLSGGQQQLASFARSMLMNSRFFMLDEPTEGLMPKLVSRIGEIVRSLKQSATTVLLVEQNVQLGMSVCDHIYFLEKGKIIDQATPAVAGEKNLIDRYLGVVASNANVSN